MLAYFSDINNINHSLKWIDNTWFVDPLLICITQ